MANKRSDSDYEIEALTKGLAVLEALEGTNFEPVPVARIIERSQLPRDTVNRTLKTFRLRGWAVQTERGDWMVGRRFIRIAHATANAFPIPDRMRDEIEDLKNSCAQEFKASDSTLSY
jgi:DNA-binding IclR family transcriptional regulator